MYYFETGKTDPAYNLAFEEYLLLHHTEGDILIFWQNDNTIVVGKNQNTEEEINRAFVKEHGIRVVRRSTGGGAVYHDLGNLNYSFITDVGNASQMSLQSFTAPIIRALTKMGVTAEANGKNDITIDGKKVSGTAQRIEGTRILHHGTLLFHSDPSRIAGALNPKTDKFNSKSTKSVQSRVGNILDFLPEKMTLETFWDALRKELAGTSAMSVITSEEKEKIEQRADSRYRTWEWTYGRSPAFSLRGSRRTSGGTVEVYADVKNGSIEQIQFLGDFMARRSMDDLTAALAGCRFERRAVSEVLGRFPLPDYFGNIPDMELLDIIFT